MDGMIKYRTKLIMNEKFVVKKFLKSLSMFFPRCIIPNSNYKRAELHVFADSSKLAYMPLFIMAVLFMKTV